MTRIHADKLTHGRLVASRPGSCIRTDARHSRCNPLLRVQCWDSTAHGKGAGHSRKVLLHRPQQPCVRDLSIMSVRRLLGSKITPETRVPAHMASLSMCVNCRCLLKETQTETYHFPKFACSSLEYGSLKPVKGQFRWTIDRSKCTQTSLTTPFPEQTVGEYVLCSIGIGLHSLRQVLQLLVTSTRCLIGRATIVDVDVPTHRRANEVTHHRCTFVIGGELASFDF